MSIVLPTGVSTYGEATDVVIDPIGVEMLVRDTLDKAR
jgi:hypothetical protein